MGIETSPAHQSDDFERAVVPTETDRVVDGARGARAGRWLVALPVAAVFLAVGLFGAYRYLDNFWLYRGFAPPHDPAFVQIHGRSETFNVSSVALGGRAQQVVVYLPPGYDSNLGRRYPVMYLLHGFPGRPLAFLETVRMGVWMDTLFAQKKLNGIILVMPSGSTGTFEDKEWANGIRRGEGWETFVARDVVRAIDSRYRTIPSSAGRAIAGLSEGGYGAINIAFHHPDEFGVVESWSGYMRADKIAAIFGGRPKLLAYNSPIDYLPRVAAVLRQRHVYVWFYSGSTDRLRFQNAAFAAELTRYRIAHTYFVDPGGHTWRIWRANARASLLVAAARLGRG
jgi:enterochelin esterase-like enzyme